MLNRKIKMRIERFAEIVRCDRPTFRTRKLAMKYLYQFKEICPVSLPRVEVRVVKQHDLEFAGLAFIEGSNTILLAQELFAEYPNDVKAVVWHELLHVLGFDHDDSTLMSPSGLCGANLTDEQLTAAVLKYF
jgi:hypothetical protein